MSFLGYSGQGGATAGTGDANVLRFWIRQMIAKVNTCEFVKVVAVTPANTGGADIAAGTVDVTPLVNMIDLAGIPTPVGPVFALPYFRLRGGTSAIIIDPVVGDTGIAVYAQRDVTWALKNREVSNPASRRRYDRADGFYFGMFDDDDDPTEYLSVSSGKIVATPDKGVTSITMTPGEIVLQAASIVLAGGGPAVARVGDEVQVGDATGTIITGSSKVTSG